MLETDSVTQLLGLVESDSVDVPILPVLRSVLGFGMVPATLQEHGPRLLQHLDVAPGAPQRTDHLHLLAQLDLPEASARLRQIAEDTTDPDSFFAAKLVGGEPLRGHLPQLLARLTETADVAALRELAWLPLHEYGGDVSAAAFADALSSTVVEDRLWASVAVAKLGDVAPLLRVLDDVETTPPDWMYGDPWTAYDVLSRARPLPESACAALVSRDSDSLARNQSLLIWALTGTRDAEGSPVGTSGGQPAHPVDTGPAETVDSSVTAAILEDVRVAASRGDVMLVPHASLHLAGSTSSQERAEIVTLLVEAGLAEDDHGAAMAWGNAAMTAIGGSSALPLDPVHLVGSYLASDDTRLDRRQLGAVLGRAEDDGVVRAVVAALRETPDRAHDLLEVLEESAHGEVTYVGSGGGGGTRASELPPTMSMAPPPPPSMAPPPPPPMPPPPVAAHPPTMGSDFGGLLLGDELESAPPPETGAEADSVEVAETAEPVAERQWWVDIRDHDLTTAPVQVGVDHTVEFSVASEGRGVRTAFESGLFEDEAVQSQTLTIQVSSKELEIIGNPVQELVVPRAGPTQTPAAFVVRARQPGACTLTATVHLSGNFVTLLHFTVWAGTPGPVTLTKVGRPPDSLQHLQPRDLMLVLEHAPGGGYRCTSIGGGSYQPPAMLPISSAQLAAEVDHVQQQLLDVIKLTDGDVPVFQTGIQVSEETAGVALTTLARAGARLFRRLFFHPQAGPDANSLGDRVAGAATDAQSLLTLQIIESEAAIPWPLLYVGDVSDDAVLDWQSFLGLRHLIEQVPLSPEHNDSGPTIGSSPQLTVGLNVNLKIGADSLNAKVAEHHQRWQGLPGSRQGIVLAPRNSRTAVLDALKDPANTDQILYFYCHATAQGRDGDKGAAAIVMEPQQPLTLDDLERNADARLRLTNRPLVFINACESADLTPLFYTGFVPYFLSRGARGVIGTQCKTPALFAIWFAQAFFDRLFDGQPVGEAMLATRRDFLDRYRNPLGLLYAVHCDIDTRIDPAMLAPGA